MISQLTAEIDVMPKRTEPGKVKLQLSPNERIDALRKKAEQFLARAKAIEARNSQTERKADTRRKIILGGLLIDAAGKDESFARVLQSLLGRIERDHDRKPFDGWDVPGSNA